MNGWDDFVGMLDIEQRRAIASLDLVSCWGVVDIVEVVIVGDVVVCRQLDIDDDRSHNRTCRFGNHDRFVDKNAQKGNKKLIRSSRGKIFFACLVPLLSGFLHRVVVFKVEKVSGDNFTPVFRGSQHQCVSHV